MVAAVHGYNSTRTPSSIGFYRFGLVASDLSSFALCRGFATKTKVTVLPWRRGGGGVTGNSCLC